MFVGEESWQVVVGAPQRYRAKLWPVSEDYAMQFVNANTTWYVANTSYDLISGRYVAELNNEERDAIFFGEKMKRKEFTTSALRRSGRR